MIEIVLRIGGQPLVAELDEDAVAAIAAALPTASEPWPAWMDVREAARYLGVTVGRVEKLKARGKIPSYQEGRGCRVSFHRPELDAWMKGFRAEPRGGDA